MHHLRGGVGRPQAQRRRPRPPPPTGRSASTCRRRRRWRRRRPASRAARSRSRDRAAAKARSATRCPQTSGSACTPCVRPTLIVSRCASPWSRSAATSRSALASRTSRGLGELHGQRGVEQVGRRHAVVHVRRGRPRLGVVGPRGEEGDDVVLRRLLDLGDPLRASAAGRCAPARRRRRAPGRRRRAPPGPASPPGTTARTCAGRSRPGPSRAACSARSSGYRPVQLSSSHHGTSSRRASVIMDGPYGPAEVLDAATGQRPRGSARPRAHPAGRRTRPARLARARRRPRRSWSDERRSTRRRPRPTTTLPTTATRTPDDDGHPTAPATGPPASDRTRRRRRPASPGQPGSPARPTSDDGRPASAARRAAGAARRASGPRRGAGARAVRRRRPVPAGLRIAGGLVVAGDRRRRGALPAAAASAGAARGRRPGARRAAAGRAAAAGRRRTGPAGLAAVAGGASRCCWSGSLVVAGIITLVVDRFSAGFADLTSQVSQGLGAGADVRSCAPSRSPAASSTTPSRQAAARARSTTSGTIASGALTTAGTVGRGLHRHAADPAHPLLLPQGRPVHLAVAGRPACRATPRAYVDEAARRSWRTLISYVRATVAVALIDAIGIGIGLVDPRGAAGPPAGRAGLHRRLHPDHRVVHRRHRSPCWSRWCPTASSPR